MILYNPMAMAHRMMIEVISILSAHCPFCNNSRILSSSSPEIRSSCSRIREILMIISAVSDCTRTWKRINLILLLLKVRIG